MEKVGISFHSTLSADELNSRFIAPLRAAVQREKAGIYSNHLRHDDPQSADATEHLLIFEVRDFKVGLRVLRVELEKLGSLDDFALHNLNPSQPSY